MREHRYQVYVDYLNGEYDSAFYCTPRRAIEAWYRNQVKHPTCVAICATSIENANLLIDYAYSRKDVIEELHSKYKICYKLQFILDAIEKKHEDRCKGFLGYLDQVHPFDLG